MQSPAMQMAAEALQQAIAASGGVLICGERGTEGELFARAIHRAVHDDAFTGSVEALISGQLQDPGSSRPFVVVDCSRGLDVEARLFGACDQARNGAPPERLAQGCAIDEASDGTLLLDHVTQMPRRAQLRLLAVLREGEAIVGGDGIRPVPRPIRVRLMATIEPFELDSATAHLEPELWHRLTRTMLQLPPLRERRQDIPALVEQLLGAVCARMNVPRKTASPPAIELLSALPWRGNLTELRALLSAIVVNVPGEQIRLRDVLAHVRLDGSAEVPTYRGTLREARARFEREYVAYVLKQHHGRMAEAAKALGLQRTNLYRKLRHLDVRMPARRMRNAEGDA